MKMWRATLAVFCVCIIGGPTAVVGWDVRGRLDIIPSQGKTLINFTLVTKISIEFLQGVQFTIGRSVVQKKVVADDWERRDDGLYSVHVTHIVNTAHLKGLVRALPLVSTGYSPAFCWEPIKAMIVGSAEAVKVGEPRTLTCVALSNGSTPITYKWYKSPGPTDYIHIGQQLELPASNINEGGAYSCGVQNECGKTKKSAPMNVYIEVPFLVEETTLPTAVTKDDLSFNITITGNHLHSPSIYMVGDTDEPSIQTRDIEGNFHYGQRKAKLFTMHWKVAGTGGNATCYNTSKRLNGDYILRVMSKVTEEQVKFQVDMQCASKKTPETAKFSPDVGTLSRSGLKTGNLTAGPKRTPGTDENKPTVGTPYHSELGTGIGIGAGMILVVVLVVVGGYFIKKRMTKEQGDDINLLQA